MGIAEHTEAGDEGDGLGRHLAEPVGLVTTDGNDTGHRHGHTVILSHRPHKACDELVGQGA
ncbi:MAG TPA: hypothetical protein VK204_09755 [Nocardioidaceae bacterium]|nr:hypothetical protein [Nocardioidaceae bacterium]